jgi:RNase adapter protein RapZ
MTRKSRPDRILLVTGMSGAGKSTALDTLEDMGWEVVDNLPLRLLDRLLATTLPEGSSDRRPLAIGIDSRTRGFDAQMIADTIKDMRAHKDGSISTLFIDCNGAELERRFSETRRRHPLALDRPASDGIAREREMIAPLRRWADQVIDTTSNSTNDLRLEIRARFGDGQIDATTLAITSFGFARGLPRNADLVFDVRYLLNPHWDPALRPLTGLDENVGTYIRTDPAYSESLTRIEDLLLLLIPRYQAEGKAYVTIAFGCTGGRHRSVHVARRLRDAGFSPTVTHRDLGTIPQDSVEGAPKADEEIKVQAGTR